MRAPARVWAAILIAGIASALLSDAVTLSRDHDSATPSPSLVAIPTVLQLRTMDAAVPAATTVTEPMDREASGNLPATSSATPSATPAREATGVSIDPMERVPVFIGHQPPGRSLRGEATWFPVAGYVGAAGPRLRRALEAHFGAWRGRWVAVCVEGRTFVNCVRVQLTDWCACHPATRVIDLGNRPFSDLASLSRGVLRVTVHW